MTLALLKKTLGLKSSNQSGPILANPSVTASADPFNAGFGPGNLFDSNRDSEFATSANGVGTPFSTDPNGNYLGMTTSSTRIYATTLSSPPGEMGPIDIPSQSVSVSGTTFNTGLGDDLYVRSPYQGVNFQICMFGIYPSRS